MREPEAWLIPEIVRSAPRANGVGAVGTARREKFPTQASCPRAAGHGSLRAENPEAPVVTRSFASSCVAAVHFSDRTGAPCVPDVVEFSRCPQRCVEALPSVW
jgi:hypothetical protein